MLDWFVTKSWVARMTGLLLLAALAFAVWVVWFGGAPSLQWLQDSGWLHVDVPVIEAIALESSASNADGSTSKPLDLRQRSSIH